MVDPSPLLTLTEALRAARRGLVLVVTGAGISAASGLPTFRGTDPEAIWNESDVEMATERLFRARPAAHWRWFVDRFSALAGAAPNSAHRSLAALERWQASRGGELLVVTQNIDTLHERAGQANLIKVHGTVDRFRCSRQGCHLGAPYGSISGDTVDLSPFAAGGPEPARDALPRCPDCGALVRPHALLFDELYDGHADYRWEEVRRAVERMALALFVGTSFSVGVTDLVLRAALFGKVPALAIDPAPPADDPYPWLRRLKAPAEELLPAACRALGLELEPASATRAGADGETAS